MISAWDVYWVMQLDSIGRFLSGMGALILSAGLLVLIPYRIFSSCKERDEEAKEISFALHPFRNVIFWGIGMLLLNTLLPSTQTAAAMIVLPAITSEQAVETIKPEAKELYDLAKGALKQLSVERAKIESEEGK